MFDWTAAVAFIVVFISIGVWFYNRIYMLDFCVISDIIANKTLSSRCKCRALSRRISRCRGFADTLYPEYFLEIVDLDESELQKEMNGYLRDLLLFAKRNNIEVK